MRKVTQAPTEFEFGETGERIEYHRTKKGLSQQELADMIGIKRQALGYIVGGTREPTIKILKELSRVLGISTDYLLCLSDISSGSADDMAVEKRLGLTKKVQEAFWFFCNVEHELGRISNALIESDIYFEMITTISKAAFKKSSIFAQISSYSELDNLLEANGYTTDDLDLLELIKIQELIKEFYFDYLNSRVEEYRKAGEDNGE